MGIGAVQARLEAAKAHYRLAVFRRAPAYPELAFAGTPGEEIGRGRRPARLLPFSNV
jgi:hypothetical protein